MRFAMTSAALALLCAATVLGGSALAGPERVQLPEDYRTRLMIYTRVDRPDRSPAVVRFMYTQPETLQRTRAGETLPDGTLIVMEDHKALADADGTPVRDAQGRLVPTDEITNVFVQQKGEGWGEAYPANKRNDDWEYAWFTPELSLRTDRSMDGCFACHMRRSGQDYNFTLSAYLQMTKGGR